MKFILKNECKMDQKLFCLAVSDQFVYIGGSGKLLIKYTIDLRDRVDLCEHNKSIRCIDVKGDLVICGSYDGSATILYQDKMFETIEGPETEIKGVVLLHDQMNNNQIGLCSRGKTAWILKFDQKIEIETVLEDHTQDIKGIQFHNDHVYTYGYDNTIKIYTKFEEFDGSWVLYQSLDVLDSTIWDILILEKLYVACHDGYIAIFQREGKFWKLETKIKISDFPIYTICAISNNIAINIDLFNIAVLNKELDIILYHKTDTYDEINEIKYNENKNLLFTVDDGGFIRSYTLSHD